MNPVKCPACDEVLYVDRYGYIISAETGLHLKQHNLMYLSGRCRICSKKVQGTPVITHLQTHTEAEIALHILGNL